MSNFSEILQIFPNRIQFGLEKNCNILERENSESNWNQFQKICNISEKMTHLLTYWDDVCADVGLMQVDQFPQNQAGFGDVLSHFDFVAKFTVKNVNKDFTKYGFPKQMSHFF